MGGWIYDRLTLVHENENNDFGRIIESNKLDHISTAYEQRPLGSFFLQYQAGSGSIIITLHILVTKLSNSVIILMKAMWFSVSECDLCF